MILPDAIPMDPFDVVDCTACRMMSALTIAPPRYICVACGETGTIVDGLSVADAKSDRAMKDAFNSLAKQRAGLKEFTKLARAHRRARVRGV